MIRMKKVILIFALLAMMCTGCETVGKGLSADDMGTSYESNH